MYMLFGKKRDEKALPDLPPSPINLKRGGIIQPEIESEDIEDKSLPSFPDSPTHNKFSQAAIKDAVEDEEENEELAELPEEGEEVGNTVEMEEWNPNIQARGDFTVPKSSSTNVFFPEQESPRRIFAPRQRLTSEEVPVSSISSRTPDVFVKIDKYHTARKSLNDIFSKLQEIDSLIKRIRDTKLREEQEISIWEKDVSQIKARIQNVTENIFEKTE